MYCKYCGNETTNNYCKNCNNKQNKINKPLIITLSIFLFISVFFGTIFLLRKYENISDNISASTTKVYVGSKNSDKYHKPSCKWAKNIKGTNKITFSSEEQAINKGYSACKTCKP